MNGHYYGGRRHLIQESLLISSYMIFGHILFIQHLHLTHFRPSQSILVNTTIPIKQHCINSPITSFIQFTLIILLTMHLLRLLNLSLKQSPQKPLRPFLSFKGTPLQRLLCASDPPEYPASQRLNLSLQHQRSQRQQKSTMRAKGVSQSQRIAGNQQGRNNSIRISKHTYRINRNPYFKSEAKISKYNNSSHRQAAYIPKNGEKKMATIEIVGEFYENSTIFSRKKKNGELKRQSKVQASPKQRTSDDAKRMRNKKSKLLNLVGVGCKMFEANPILWRKLNEVSPSQPNQA